MKMKYKSRIGLLWISVILVMIACHWPLFQMMNFSDMNFWIGVCVLIPTDILLINITGDTWYQFHENYLEIKSGVFTHLKIPYGDMIQFRETHNPLASSGLSMDRLDILFHAQNGGNGKDEIFISPVRKQEFIHELEKKTDMMLTVGH